MKMACARCSKVLALEIEVDGTTYSSDADDSLAGTPDDFQVDVKGGVLMAVCAECVTTKEAHHKLMQTSSHMLEVAEEYLAYMDMVFERIPAIRDDPQAKAQYAKVQGQAAEARAWLQALIENPPPEDE